MKEWKKRLYIISISQFAVMTGFGLVLPFVAYYLRELGAGDANINLYVGISTALPALGMAIFSPIWGSLSDKYGRKAMLLRAQIGGAVILLCLAFSKSVAMFLVFRGLQGSLTGTLPSASAFLSAHMPEDKLSSSLGVMTAAHFLGYTCGPVIGGFLSEMFGYRVCFIIASALMGLTALAISVLLKEDPNTYGQAIIAARKKRTKFGKPQKLFTVFITMCMLTIFFTRVAKSAFMPYISLYVQDVNGLENASVITGLIAGGECIGISAAALILTRFKNSESGFKVIIITSIISVPIAVGCYLVSGISVFIFGILFMCMHFTIGGIEPIVNSLASKAVDMSQRGIMFGWFSTAINISTVITPMISAFIADLSGYTSILLFASCVIIIGLITILVAYKFKDRNAAEEIAN